MTFGVLALMAIVPSLIAAGLLLLRVASSMGFALTPIVLCALPGTILLLAYDGHMRSRAKGWLSSCADATIASQD